MKKSAFYIAALLILPLSLLLTILFNDIVCFNGLSSFKIETNDIPAWVKIKVAKELKPFKSIDTKDFSPFYKLASENKIKNLVVVKIFANKVEVIGDGGSRARKLKETIEKILESNKLNNLEFIVYLWDDVHYGQNKSFLLKELQDQGIDITKLPPIFAFAANKTASDRKSFILMPDSQLSLDKSIFNRLGWSCLSKRIADATAKSLWNNKREVAFWRGAGWCYAHRDYYKRGYVVELSQKYPELLDAKYTPDPKSDKAFMRRKLEHIYKFFNIDPYVSFDKYVNNKILLDLDANTVSYPGMYWKLFTKSVVLKQMTNNEIFLSDEFIPWVHFVPMRYDTKDIIEKIHWIKSHDREARQMAKTASNMIKENFMPKHFDIYVYYLLDQYSSLLK